MQWELLMDMNRLTVSVFLFALVSLAFSGAPDVGLPGIIQETRSNQLVERVRGVKRVLAQRDAIAAGLVGIVSQANEGKTDPESKAVALYLMGELGLVQCKEVLVAERDWKRVVEDMEEILWLNDHEEQRMDWLVGCPARFALGRAGFGPPGTINLAMQRDVKALSDYPRLTAAIEDLASHRRQERRRGEGTLLQWYESVCGAMNEVLDPLSAFPNEVRSTAAYVLGEFRTMDSTMLIWNIDLVDETGTCNEYPVTFSVKTTQHNNPCVVALLKVGGRLSIDQGLSRIETKDLPQNTRDLLLHTLLAVDAEATRSNYHTRVECLAAAVREYPDAEVDAERAKVQFEKMPRGLPGSRAAKEREAARAAAEGPRLRLRIRAGLKRLLAVRSIVEERARSGRTKPETAPATNPATLK